MLLQFSETSTATMSTYLTCEFATFSKDGTPIAWPVSALYQPESTTLLVSTTIGFPQKAINVRRDPRVSALYSDPTGSGSDDGVQVLLQGTAVCSDQIETGFAGRAAYWRRLLAIQPPAAGSFASTALGRRVMDAYFMRLYITMTPLTELVLPAATNARPIRPATRRRYGSSAFQNTAAAVVQFDSAVLATNSSTGYATLQRVRLVPHGDEASFEVAPAPGTDVVAGRASILCHRHDERLGSQSSFVATGELREAGGGWVFVPERFVAGISPGVISQIGFLRTLRRRARTYLQTRRLDRPVIAWDELADIVKSL